MLLVLVMKCKHEPEKQKRHTAPLMKRMQLPWNAFYSSAAGGAAPFVRLNGRNRHPSQRSEEDKFRSCTQVKWKTLSATIHFYLGFWRWTAYIFRYFVKCHCTLKLGTNLCTNTDLRTLVLSLGAITWKEAYWSTPTCEIWRGSKPEDPLKDLRFLST